MFSLQSQQGYVYLAPVVAAFVAQLVKNLGDMVVAVVYNNVVVSALKFPIPPHNSLIPLLSCIFLVIQNHVF